MLFRSKDELVRWGNRMAIAGLVSLSLAIAASVSVVADLLYGDALRVPLTFLLLGLIGAVWFLPPVFFSSGDDG